MYARTTRSNCLPRSDDRFGPRVNINCRDFDFTFLFEDAIFILLPAIIFVLLLTGRIWQLSKHPVQRLSYKLGAFKIVSADQKTVIQLLTPLFSPVYVHCAFCTLCILSSAIEIKYCKPQYPPLQGSQAQPPQWEQYWCRF